MFYIYTSLSQSVGVIVGKQTKGAGLSECSLSPLGVGLLIEEKEAASRLDVDEDVLSGAEEVAVLPEQTEPSDSLLVADGGRNEKLMGGNHFQLVYSLH